MIKTEIGKYLEIKPSEGKILLVEGVMLKCILVSPNYDLSIIEEIDDSNYIPPNEEIIDETIEDSLLALKNNQIKLSKSNLSTYLEENPLFSTVKYEDGRYYNVTLEKQYSLMDTLVKHTIFNGTKPLYWNSVGQTSEVWRYEELLQLSTEIEDYVSPLVELQRQVELRIRECTTQDEVLSIDINPYKEVAMRLNEINTLNNK